MNIYEIYWVQSGCFGLTAVVIASDEITAIQELRLSDDDRMDHVSLIGAEIEPSAEPRVVAQESL